MGIANFLLRFWDAGAAPRASGCAADLCDSREATRARRCASLVGTLAEFGGGRKKSTARNAYGRDYASEPTGLAAAAFPRASLTDESIIIPTTKNAPIERIAGRWLPVVLEIVPKMIGPRKASALPAMPRNPKNSEAFSLGVKSASRLRVTD